MEKHSKQSQAKYLEFARLGEAVYDRVIGALFYLACILLTLPVLVISFEITYRFFTGRSQMWVVEFSEYVLLLIPFLATAWVLKKGQHIRMDIVVNRFNIRTQAILNIVASVIAALICLVLVWYGWDVTWESFLKGTRFFNVIGLPRAPFTVFIPIGGFLLFIGFIRNILKYMAALGTSGPVADSHDV